MKPRTITTLVIIGAALLIIGYDIAIYLWVGGQATISTVILRFSEAHHGLSLIIVLVIGVLIGHVFWPQRSKDKELGILR